MDDDLEALAGGDRSGLAVHAGFPNPAAERAGARELSLDQLLIRHPSSTYLFRIRGDTWMGEGIFDGDIAIIDRSLDAHTHDLVISWQDEHFTLTHFERIAQLHLQPWGVVTGIIHEYRKSSRPAIHQL